MPAGMFVNPLPRLLAFKLLQFDFPVDYRAPGTSANVNIDAPGIEALYGQLGTPPKEQGHPCLRERVPEQEDPAFGRQDQIIDIDRPAVINHTGRLSGSFVRFLAHPTFKSIVRMDAHPLTYDGPVISLATIERPLTPMTNAPNVWYWRDPSTRQELLFTAHVDFDPSGKGLRAGNIYKLITRWEFWDTGITPAERMPISGFNEVIAFEVSAATAGL